MQVRMDGARRSPAARYVGGTAWPGALVVRITVAPPGLPDGWDGPQPDNARHYTRAGRAGRCCDARKRVKAGDAPGSHAGYRDSIAIRSQRPYWPTPEDHPAKRRAIAALQASKHSDQAPLYCGS